jgi:phosphate transport system permease protein
MSGLALVIVVFGLALIGWLAARMRAATFRKPGVARFTALPVHYGYFVALAALVPPLLFLAAWSLTSPALVTDAVIATPAAATLPPPGFERASILSEARALASGRSHVPFHALSVRLAPAYAAAQARYDWIATALALCLAIGGGALAFTRVRPDFAARTQVERVVMLLLLCASLIAILTTVGIVASLLYESGRFFGIVPIGQFLFGTHWSPQVILPDDPGASLGAVPLFWGTFFIGAVIAMAVAVPFGLMSAIYLTQYAHAATRRWMKPVLEMLAGVPTVVYGYFAALTVAPAVRQLGLALGIANASSESALAAGVVMGIMIIPFVSSMATR